jgi:hypothetical protein
VNEFNEECLYIYNKFGETVVQNICTYEKIVVSWGFGNWFNFIVVIFAIVAVYIEILKTIEELKKEKH